MIRGYSLMLCSAIAAVSTTCSLAEDKPPISVSIQCPQSEVKSGTEVKLLITVTNTSESDVEVYKAPGPDGQAEAVDKIEVRDASGNLLPRIDGQTVVIGGAKHTIPRRWMSRKSVLLAPGGRLVDFTILSNLFDLSKPGQYTVIVRNERRADGSGPDLKEVYSTSNKITITVTE